MCHSDSYVCVLPMSPSPAKNASNGSIGLLLLVFDLDFFFSLIGSPSPSTDFLDFFVFFLGFISPSVNSYMYTTHMLHKHIVHHAAELFILDRLQTQSYFVLFHISRHCTVLLRSYRHRKKKFNILPGLVKEPKQCFKYLFKCKDFVGDLLLQTQMTFHDIWHWSLGFHQ